LTIIQIKRLDERALLPVAAYEDDAGHDLLVLEDTWIGVNSGKDVRTGIAVAIPPGFYGRICGRSSALRKRGLLVVDGVIDCQYRGELYSYVFCPATQRTVAESGVQLERGDSVAQLIVTPVPRVEWEEVDELPTSERGTRGFGSSGR
jgi:dUTP diphosphatase